MKFASLFTGFGGVEIAAKAAGLSLLWGIEIDADIAGVANRNLGEHVKIANVLDCNPTDFERPDILHASPVCTRASNAKTNATESPLDIAMAEKTAEFIAILQPDIFTMENVWGYRSFSSFLIICDTLRDYGYNFGYWHLNSADYGVPQLRHRLIMIADKTGRTPQRPEPTHYDPKRDGGLSGMMGLSPWVGWYQAIEDLLPSLKESKFADWQLKKMPEKYKSFLLGNSTRSDIVYNNEPSETITANHNQSTLKAFLADGNIAFRDNVTICENQEPSYTVSANIKAPRAFLVNGGNSNRDMTILDNGDASYTITSNMVKSPCKAFSNGRIVELSTRCLARLQSFPDWYELPEKVTLACKGIGNAVPPLLYQRIIESELRRF